MPKKNRCECMSPMKTGAASSAWTGEAQRAGGGQRPLHELPAIDFHCLAARTAGPAYSITDRRHVVHRAVVVVGRQQRVDEEGRGRIVLRDAGPVEAGADEARAPVLPHAAGHADVVALQLRELRLHLLGHLSWPTDILARPAGFSVKMLSMISLRASSGSFIWSITSSGPSARPEYELLAVQRQDVARRPHRLHRLLDARGNAAALERSGVLHRIAVAQRQQREHELRAVHVERLGGLVLAERDRTEVLDERHSHRLNFRRL